MLKRILFVIAALFLFFFLLDKIPLWSSDEGRFGEIAREMLESKQFIVPHFNHLPYLDKPVLAPLLTAGAYSLFGINALAARLVSVMAALLGIFFLHRFTRRLFDPRAADFSAVVLLTTAGYALVGRFAVIDMLMTFLLSMTLFCFMTAFFEQKRGYYLAGYGLMGLAFLTKGLIALVLPAGIFLIFLLGTKNLGELKRMRLVAGFAIIALVILPWILSISRQEPEFFNEFILKQHFSRFATGTFGRKRPFWFFAPILIASAFPWTCFLPAAIARGMKEELLKRRKLQFLLCWIAVVFVFFSIPKSKLPYYILPVSMPIAILIGDFFAKLTAVPESPARKKFFVLAGTVYGGLILTFVIMKVISPFQSTRDYADFLKSRMRPGDVAAVYASPDKFSDFPFYMKQRIMIVGSDRGTLAGQSRQMPLAEQKENFLETGEFAALFNAPSTLSGRVFCLVPAKKIQELVSAGLRRYEVVMAGHGKLLISTTGSGTGPSEA
ncbi:MAG TPA: glycosyltransferase family 39 protein [bacterium]|nr:glycosyltransferase family 39 protein [bacterium]